MSIGSIIVRDRDAAGSGAGPTGAMQAEAKKPEPRPDPALTESILGGVPEEAGAEPACFTDLNLDQIVAAVINGRQEYNLVPFFRAPLLQADAVRYRHEVFRDLEDGAVSGAVRRFAQRMRELRETLAKAAKLHYRYQKERVVLDAVTSYCEAATDLSGDFSQARLQSRGLIAFRDFLARHTCSSQFLALRREAMRIKDELSNVRYCLHIKGGHIRVRKPENEIDYSAEVEKTFDRFNRGAVKDYLANFSDFFEMNHIEAAVLGMVAQLYPPLFEALDTFCAANATFVDPKISAFDRQAQFYLAYLDYIAPLRRDGLDFCYPEVLSGGKDICSTGSFDLALAQKLHAEKAVVVGNDFHLNGAERIFVVTGPNQGGKTTFARAFGQLHYLASLGCPVPGKSARLLLFDQLFTHFEKEEDVRSLHGKLEDDLLRIHQILHAATADSIVVMNEIFTSTTLHDALFLGREIMERLSGLDLLAVCVTFVDELSRLNEKTVSLVSTVDPKNTVRRTFKIVRRPADGLSHAMAIASRHRLAYGDLRKRLAP
ncbi:DNA mismatch repair protein MutS [Mesorhizobium sp. VK25A]|uniref:DNA mismatch repair protein MutS n=1 Tax=Mesorhizobium vachelliae TaxID=3072309 RepID=A0ABU5A4A8_9HYPH|nr:MULTISPECIES: DNA mismatch repair protein MutS [unclassified Mesorhizobium]MDX8532531.1 DNA mismatch repair protein MutS [Mesorhizobium sp. VK25D]MDX8547823.1 DNA mismatch repair protein MutS [Mesorhizobium sp. VK25A]